MLISGLWGAGTPCAWWAGTLQQPILPRPLLPNLPCESRMKASLQLGLLCYWGEVASFVYKLIPSACHSEYSSALRGGAESYGPLVPFKSCHTVWVANLCGMYFNPNLCFLGQVQFLPHPFLVSCLTQVSIHLYDHLTLSTHHLWHSDWANLLVQVPNFKPGWWKTWSMTIFWVEQSGWRSNWWGCGN